MKFRESRDEPQAGKIRIHGNNQPFRVLPAAQLRNRTLNDGESRGERPKQFLAIIGQNDFPRMPLEKIPPQLLLQFLDVPAHRRVVDVQLIAGSPDALMPRRRLEGSQPVEYGKAKFPHKHPIP